MSLAALSQERFAARELPRAAVFLEEEAVVFSLCMHWSTVCKHQYLQLEEGFAISLNLMVRVGLP